eukprot:m.376030 g.376030  ORF g.376030 m.376030 type:complete len:192 (-) comp56185_c0_seq10:193-768(-)
MNPEHVFHYLTPDEIKSILPSKRIVPVTFKVEAGKSLLIGGVARVDFEQGDHPALFTLFGSNHLKTHLTTIENSEAFYSKHLGSELLAPPFGSADRLKTFPALEGKQFEIQGAGQRQVSTDIVLGGVGWLSLTYAYQQRMTVKAWTPKGLGLFTRPALDQLAVNQHGPILPQSKFEVRRTRPVQTLKSWRR